MKFADTLLALLRKRGAAWEDDAQDEDDPLRDVATKSGIADIDPEPLSHVAGEGIDLEGDVKAHEELRYQREKMPHRQHRH